MIRLFAKLLLDPITFNYVANLPLGVDSQKGVISRQKANCSG
jgi:hypothetical protein